MRLVAAAIAMTMLSACAGTFSTKDRSAVEGVLQAQADAWNRGDLDGYMAGYARTPELVFTSGAKVRRGWQETRDAYVKKYGSDPRGMGKLSFELLQVQPVGADGAVVLGRWQLRDTPNAGGGIFSVVLERRPEGWRVVHDHTSSDAL